MVIAWQLWMTFWWVTMTPLGAPVDPDVYWRYSVSIGFSVRTSPRGVPCTRSVASQVTPRDPRGSAVANRVPGEGRDDESVNTRTAPLSCRIEMSRCSRPVPPAVTGGTGTGIAPIREHAMNAATISSPGEYINATRSPE